MSAIRIQVLFYFCSLICLVAQGQSLTISGKIIDAKVEGIHWNTPEIWKEINALNR